MRKQRPNRDPEDIPYQAEEVLDRLRRGVLTCERVLLAAQHGHPAALFIFPKARRAQDTIEGYTSFNRAECHGLSYELGRQIYQAFRPMLAALRRDDGADRVMGFRLVETMDNAFHARDARLHGEPVAEGDYSSELRHYAEECGRAHQTLRNNLLYATLHACQTKWTESNNRPVLVARHALEAARSVWDGADELYQQQVYGQHETTARYLMKEYR